MKNLTVALDNHRRADEELAQIAAAGRSPKGQGRFLFFPGPAGSGKSTFAHEFVRRTGAPSLTFRITSTPRATVRELAPQILGFHVHKHGVDEFLLRLADALVKDRPDIDFIVLDEGDSLNQAPRFVLLHLFRFLADWTGVAIAIFATGALMRRLATPTPYLEHITSRTAANVEFRAPVLADAIRLAKLVEGVELEKDFVAWCLKTARGSLRPLVNLFSADRASGAGRGHRGQTRCRSGDQAGDNRKFGHSQRIRSRPFRVSWF